MLLRIPFIHQRQHALGLVNREYGPVGDDVQLLVRHDCRDFDDGIRVGLEARHFQVDPDQIVTARHCAWTIHNSRVELEFTRGYPETALCLTPSMLWSSRPLDVTSWCAIRP